MDFKQTIKNRRLELGLTLEEVGKIVGVSKTTIQRWESGAIENQRRDKLELLAKALKTTPGELMGWDANRPASSEDILPNVNIIKIAGRDGSYVERRLTDEQYKAWKTVVGNLPDADDL